MRKKKKLFGIEMRLDQWGLVFLAGVALLFLSFPVEKKPENTVAEQKTAGETVTEKSYYEELEERLQNMLRQAQGVGEAEVMITLKSTEEKQVEKDTSKREDTVSEEDSQGGSRSSYTYEEEGVVVFTEDENGNQVPYVVKELLPEIEGVLVLCEGADKASVQTEVYEAVEALLGVPAHKIKVLKKVSE